MSKYLSIVVVIVLVWLYRLGLQDIQAQPVGWSAELADRLGNSSPSREILVFIDSWKEAEGTSAQNNPLATTLDRPGSSCFNEVCVRNYTTEEEGIEATVVTLAQGFDGYNDIVLGIRNNDVQRALSGLKRSPWGTDASLVERLVDEKLDLKPSRTEIAAKGKKCPYTKTMSVASTFYSTEGPWGGQYGGFHLGDDFTGDEGDEVLAPFDMVIESTGRYDDPDRFGNNIQGRFLSDKVLYYAGHLIDVYVKPGDTVAACTVIATLGATSFKHTHIKLGGPNAPVPCELTEPGWDTGCIDPIEYWNTH